MGFIVRLFGLSKSFMFELTTANGILQCDPIYTSTTIPILIKTWRLICTLFIPSTVYVVYSEHSARSKKTLGDRAFKTAAPKIWNILPEDIRMQDNYSIFKGQLKTHYFRLAYNF